MKNKRLISAICSIAMLVPLFAVSSAAINRDADASELPVNDNLSYHDVDITIPSTKSKYSANYSSSKPNVTIPSKYDMRVSSPETLPIVRDQNPHGMCWAFSAIESAETNLTKKGLADNTIDLSELQLAYFMYHQNTDPLGNSTGDYNSISNGDTLIDMGGNTFFTTYTLANWTGVATESTMPYSDATYAVGAEYSSSLRTDMDFAHLQNAYWINMTDDPESVKAFVITNGAVGMAYYEDHSSWSAGKMAYFQNTYSYTNHAVAIVGWDDNYSRENFSERLQPAHDGAWLIRNSWGTSTHDGGYFWLSYEDKSIYDQTAFVFDMESSDNYAHNYQYDGSSSIGSFSVEDNSTATISNVFTSQNDENLEAVAFSNPMNTNISYNVNIYLNPTNPAKPDSGTLIADASTSGFEVYSGYHTIELASAVQLHKDDVFAVVITIADTQGDPLYIPFDSNMDYGWINCHSVSQAGQSFYSFDNGETWRDMTSYKPNANLRIKAFTNEVGLDSPSGITASVDSDKAVTVKWNAVADATSYDVYSQTENETEYTKIATVTNNEYTYTCGAANGTSVFYKIMAHNDTASSAFSLGAGVRMPITRHLFSFDFEITDWVTTPIAIDLPVGSSQNTSVVYYNNGDDKTMAYYSENTKIATISPTGVITATGYGTTSVHAVARDCSDESGRDKEITVYVPKDIYVQSVDQLQSAHPYKANIDERYIYKVAGATSISVTFSDNTKTVPGNDTIRIYDSNNTLIGTYSGATLAGKTIKVTGDTFIVRLQTVSGTYYGFKAESIVSDGDLVKKSALQDKISEYSTLKASDYSIDSWASYQEVLTRAKAAINDITATQDIIDALVIELTEAHDALMPYIPVTGVTINVDDAIEKNGNYFIIVPENEAFDSAGIQLKYTVTPEDAMFATSTWSNDDGFVGVDNTGYASPHWDFASEDLISLTLTDHFGKSYSDEVMLYFVHYMSDKIILSDSSLYMTVGSEDKTITASVTDNNGHTADYEEMTWSTDNSNVATVENGVITAKAIGTAVIRATSDVTGVYSECTVHVTDGTISVVPTDGTNTVVDNTNKYIYGLDAGINSLEGYAEITDSSCSFQYERGELGFGTSTVAKVIKDGNVIDAYTIVIFGDVNGDGWYNGEDSTIVSCLSNGLLAENQVSPAQYKAADCNHDGAIDDIDVELLNQAGILLGKVDQNLSGDELHTSSAYMSYVSLIDQTEEAPEEVIDPIPEPTNPTNSFLSVINYIITVIKNIVLRFASLFSF